MNAYWSWLLTAWGVTGLVLAGRKRAVGWAVGLSAQVLWVAYAVVTRQWGFIASAFIYGAVYCKNWLAWRRPAGRVPVVCWRCGAVIPDGAPHKVLRLRDHDYQVHQPGDPCVPTITKETP